MMHSYEFIKKLRAVDFTEKQAIAIIEVQQEELENFIKTSDLQKVSNEIIFAIDKVRNELKSEFKNEIRTIKDEFKNEIRAVKDDFKDEIRTVKDELKSVSSLSQELKGESKSLRKDIDELKTNMNELKNDMKWIRYLLLAIVVAVFTPYIEKLSHFLK